MDIFLKGVFYSKEEVAKVKTCLPGVELRVIVGNGTNIRYTSDILPEDKDEIKKVLTTVIKAKPELTKQFQEAKQAYLKERYLLSKNILIGIIDEKTKQDEPSDD